MKKISFAIAGATALALAACGGQGDDALADDVEDQYDAKAEQLEDQADAAEAAGNETQAEMLGEQADAMEEMGDTKEEAIDDADPVVAN